MTPAGSELARLLRKGYADDPWHGPALADLLLGIPAESAAARPVGAAHTIWELVLHIAAWQEEVLRRLDGQPPSTPKEGDWPAPASSEAAWQATLKSLAASTERLADRVTRLTADELAERVGRASRPLGTGVTKGETVAGVLQHNAYHGGQIALLRKALGV